jgi:hypothetical protein
MAQVFALDTIETPKAPVSSTYAFLFDRLGVDCRS